MSDIVTIAGSPSPNSRSSAVLEYVSETCRCNGLTTTAIHVRDIDAEDLLFANFNSPGIKRFQQEVLAARAVIVATPVYKAAYSGVLKTLLDLLPQDALRNKVVLPVATGGTLAHLLSIDYALKPVLSALGAEVIYRGIYIQDSQIQVAKGTPISFDPEIRNRLDQTVEQLIFHLLTTHQVVSIAESA